MNKLLLILITLNALMTFTAFEYIGRVYDCVSGLQLQIIQLAKAQVRAELKR